MIKLSILITHYNESEEVVNPLIQSILSQEDINFNELDVLVGNDGYENKLPVNYFNQLFCYQRLRERDLRARLRLPK